MGGAAGCSGAISLGILEPVGSVSVSRFFVYVRRDARFARLYGRMINISKL